MTDPAWNILPYPQILSHRVGATNLSFHKVCPCLFEVPWSLYFCFLGDLFLTLTRQIPHVQ
ncbi:mCG147120 [Mus musculus]|nr:mCG147120 [Mus musculus]